ncbi:hypothetical protein [Intestinibacillus sp. Marseille-P6563]|uniref:hypothetical protein n=1 Tax=Intestinibacillus sp. Marseille-P6563 TaxID=2364792 RepID=UPI000F068BEE|nr:hypothetical protein [Intestinibacillus sp. Marseille-P6563]
MRYATIDETRIITNIIEVEPDLAADFDAHYLGNNPLGIGDTYPDEDLTPPVPLTETQIFSQRLTDMQLASIAQGQRQTDLELATIEQGQKITDVELEALKNV